MSSSDEIKEAIVQYMDGTGIKGSKESDWKRRDKRTLATGHSFRMYENVKLGRSVWTIGDDEDAQILEADQWVYAYIPAGNDIYDGEPYLAFEPEDRWRRTGYQYDQHQADGLQALFQLPGDLDEVSENIFIVPPKYNALTIHILLKKLGFKHDQSYTDFLIDPNHNTPGPQPGIVPANYPQPYFLQPNYSAGLQPASTPVSQPAAPLTGMAGQYPELSAQLPEVMAALITARMLRQQGLEQVNDKWDDDQEIEKQFSANYGQDFTLYLERSHALWLLYEATDNGSGTTIPDFFSMTNDELHDHLEEHGVIDLSDDDHYYEIIDDTQVYDAPYDLPVPQPVAAPAPFYNPPPQGRPGPMVGPASMNARAGSFAALPVAPAAVAPPAPPPGNAAASMRNDSGDKWSEFCNEVWDTYEANQSNLPLDLDWQDRYRPRDVQVTGLGYKFDRMEFTGIRVLMGYLDRDGALVDTIDIPGRVFDELLKEFGGEWNIEDITQFVNKRQGTDPETGYSYSSQALWGELEPLLIAQGWKEAK